MNVRHLIEKNSQYLWTLFFFYLFYNKIGLEETSFLLLISELMIILIILISNVLLNTLYK